MDVHHPVIAVRDYESFRRLLCHNIPDSYAKWLDLRAKWEEQAAQDGQMVANVVINSDQFARYLRTKEKSPDLNSLTKFTDSVARGQFD
jgi:hypothetical protein